MKALVIGGGFTGITAAFELGKSNNWEVDLVEKNSFLGAGNRTQYYHGHPYTFGPRHFLTQDENIFNYLNKYVPMRSCSEHQFLTLGKDEEKFLNYPINFNDIEKMKDKEKINSELSDIFIQAVANTGESDINYWDYTNHTLAGNAANFEEFWINSVGTTLYNKFISSYSKKMWQVDDNKVIDDFSWSPKGVTIKKGGPECWNNAISAYPVAINGYDDFFRIASKEFNAILNSTVEHIDFDKSIAIIGGEKRKYDVIINTISIDQLMEFSYGELPYIGRDLFKIILPVEYALPENVYFVYYADENPVTRVVEYKKFTKYKSSHTLLSLEIPSLNNKHYPLPIMEEINKFKQYHDDLPDNVFTIGRAGAYMYNVDIDDAIDHGLQTVKTILGD